MTARILWLPFSLLLWMLLIGAGLGLPLTLYDCAFLDGYCMDKEGCVVPFYKLGPCIFDMVCCKVPDIDDFGKTYTCPSCYQ